MTTSCWFCGAANPISHSVVYVDGKVKGRVCAKHSIYELQIPPKGKPKFHVEVNYYLDDQPDWDKDG